MKRKLTDHERDQIREQNAGGVSQRALAAKYGVSSGTIWGILNPEKNQEQRASWVRAHPESGAARQRTRYHSNPEYVRELKTAWRANNPNEHRAQKQRRRARKQQADGTGWRTKAWHVALIHIWAGECAYCRCTKSELTLDHVVPLSQGGSHEPRNLVPACLSCNSSKGAKPLSEWRGGQHVGIQAFAAEVAASIDLLLSEAL